MKQDELKHFGVKGMKWGVRKERVSSKRRRAKRKLSPKVKRYLKIGATVAAIGLAAYGGYKFGAKYGAYDIEDPWPLHIRMYHRYLAEHNGEDPKLLQWLKLHMNTRLY